MHTTSVRQLKRKLNTNLTSIRIDQFLNSIPMKLPVRK